MEIATRRLAGSPLCQRDYEDLRCLHCDPEAMKTLTASGKPQPEAFTQGVIKRVEANWQSAGFGVWAFRTLGDAAFVGYCGLRPYLVHGEPETELLYGLLPAYWGQGLASEMAAASLEVAFQRLSRNSVVAFTLHANKASRRVMEKNGMTYEKDIIHAGLPHVLYRKYA